MPPRQLAPAPIARAFDVVALLYDFPLLQRAVYRPNQDVVIAELRRAGARRIADVGCGTGVLTARIESELEPDELYGVDLSAGMLDKASRKSPTIAWRQAPAEHLPLAAESLDAIVTTEAFHFFDQPVALAEFRRVLADDGLLIVASLNAVNDRLGRIAGWAGTTWSTAERMRELVERAGFDVAAQRPVRRALPTLFPTVATIAVAA